MFLLFAGLAFAACSKHAEPISGTSPTGLSTEEQTAILNSYVVDNVEAKQLSLNLTWREAALMGISETVYLEKAAEIDNVNQSIQTYLDEGIEVVSASAGPNTWYEADQPDYNQFTESIYRTVGASSNNVIATGFTAPKDIRLAVGSTGSRNWMATAFMQSTGPNSNNYNLTRCYYGKANKYIIEHISHPYITSPSCAAVLWQVDIKFAYSSQSSSAVEIADFKSLKDNFVKVEPGKTPTTEAILEYFAQTRPSYMGEIQSPLHAQGNLMVIGKYNVPDPN